MTISIIVPNFNGRHILRANFLAVTKAVTYYCEQSRERAEIIYVDDGSSDESTTFLSELFSLFSHPNIQLILLTHEKNKGFSSAVNTGVGRALGEIVVLFNTDVLPDRTCLLPLVEQFSDEKIFAVGCVDESIEREKKVLKGRGIGFWKRGFVLHQAGKLDAASISTFWVSGGSSAFRKSIWDMLTGMNVLYNPYYWEDIDLSYRAQKAGYRVIIEPASTVIHEHEKGAIKSQSSQAGVTTISYRNQIQFVWLNITDKKLLCLHFLWMPYHILRSVLSDRLFIQGFFLALRNMKAIKTYRSKMKRNFVKSDEAVLRIAK